MHGKKNELISGVSFFFFYKRVAPLSSTVCFVVAYGMVSAIARAGFLDTYVVHKSIIVYDVSFSCF